MGSEVRRYPSRKRSHSEDGTEGWAEDLSQAATACKKMIIFSGSGLSATSGMSMFSTKNGLYQRAKKKFKIQDGMKLFCYSFYKQRKADVQAFFAQIYSEAQASQAAAGHHAIQTIHALGKLQRHYTLNIDGLAEVVGLDIWNRDSNPNGSTVEMHGNIRHLVCPECRATSDLTRVVINQMKAKKKIMCDHCKKSEVRFKVMLYDDDEGDCITPEHVFETLDDDLQQADLLLWVGISFEQSASVEYFREVRHMLSQQGRLQHVQQVIINPSDEALFNVMSASCNTEDLPILEVKATSDQALPFIAQQLTQHLTQGPTPKTLLKPKVNSAKDQQPEDAQVSEEDDAVVRLNLRHFSPMSDKNDAFTGSKLRRTVQVGEEDDAFMVPKLRRSSLGSVWQRHSLREYDTVVRLRVEADGEGEEEDDVISDSDSDDDDDEDFEGEEESSRNRRRSGSRNQQAYRRVSKDVDSEEDRQVIRGLGVRQLPSISMTKTPPSGGRRNSVMAV